MSFLNAGFTETETILGDEDAVLRSFQDLSTHFFVDQTIFYRQDVVGAFQGFGVAHLMHEGSGALADEDAVLRSFQDLSTHFFVDQTIFYRQDAPQVGDLVLRSGVAVGLTADGSVVIVATSAVEGGTVAGIFVPSITNIPHVILVGPAGAGVRRRVEKDFSKR